jgi:hypothetical protein
VKKKGKAKLTPKERKERKVRVLVFTYYPNESMNSRRVKAAIDQIITLLPLEFRETNTVSVC